ncbi:MAG: hypothetical protein HYS05_19415, partial [Acidobacteria bacterium]|nr:hypothetical protein [Acidobacteriota bacterium]
LVGSKDFEHLAELVGRLAYDDEVRARVIEGKRRRLRDFTDERSIADLNRLLAAAR